jgi:DNA-directed RNA polymerase subunit F
MWGVRPFMWVPAALAALLALGGCGGEERTTPTFEEPPPLTRQEFIAEADRICLAVESQIEAAVDDYAAQRKPDPDEVRRAVTRIVVPKLRSEVEAIRLLDPPPEDADEVDAILAATERGAARLEDDPLSALDGIPPDLKEAERLARAYGSRQCGLR